VFEVLIILLVLTWVVGMLTVHLLGGWLHVLPLIALVVMILRVIQARRIPRP